MHSKSIFKAFAEYDADRAKHSPEPNRLPERRAAPISFPVSAATIDPLSARCSNLEAIPKEKPPNEIMLSSANERLFWDSQADHLLQKKSRRIYRQHRDRQTQLLDTANSSSARGRVADLIPQRSKLNRQEQPRILVWVFLFFTIPVAIWFRGDFYSQVPSATEATNLLRNADEIADPRRLANQREMSKGRNRSQARVRRRLLVRKHKIMAFDEEELQPKDSYSPIIDVDVENISTESTTKLTTPVHPPSPTENAALRRPDLPSRLTFGLQLELLLTEPASTLGGPVTAVTIAEVRDTDSGFVIPSGIRLLFETATNGTSGRVAIDWTKPALLLLADGRSIRLRGYIVGEDGSVNLPAAPVASESRGSEFRRTAQGLVGIGGQYARRRNTILGDLVNSVYREISQPPYQREETPIVITPSGSRFSLIIQ